MHEALAATVRAAGLRIVAALAARFRDLDLAEEAFADASARAAMVWPSKGEPDDPAAWLFRVADRCALQTLRWRKTRERILLEPPLPDPTVEDALFEKANLIPDERLKLIFICCHPAVAPESRAALTLKIVCGLSTAEIADAFLIAEPTLAQRLVRAKRKIAQAGVPFEVPGPEVWPERLEAVLSTLEITYARAHEDAAGSGRHAGYATEMLTLTGLLAELIHDDEQVAAIAAIVRYAEARRPARLDESGAMVPLSEQDPALWDSLMIAEGDRFFRRTRKTKSTSPRVLQAALHWAWCARSSSTEPAPWSAVLTIYNRLLELRDDPIVRINRAVALSEVEGPALALQEIEALDGVQLARFAPYYAVRADLLRRLSSFEKADAAYAAALALDLPRAERVWLERQRATIGR